jgi:hypothetical protein
MSRFVAADKVAILVGAASSSPVYNSLGSLGNYGIKLALILMCIIWTIFFVREPIEKHITSGTVRTNCSSSVTRWLKIYFWNPLKDVGRTFMKRRPNSLRFLLYVQVISYAIHYLESVLKSRYFGFVIMIFAVLGWTTLDSRHSECGIGVTLMKSCIWGPHVQ